MERSLLLAAVLTGIVLLAGCSAGTAPADGTATGQEDTAGGQDGSLYDTEDGQEATQQKDCDGKTAKVFNSDRQDGLQEVDISISHTGTANISELYIELRRDGAVVGNATLADFDVGDFADKRLTYTEKPDSVAVMTVGCPGTEATFSLD